MAGSRTGQASGRDVRSADAGRSWTPKESALLSSWGRRAEAAKHAHYLLATRLRRRNLWIGIPAVVVSAVVGTSLFASLANGTEGLPVELRVVIGSLSVSAAVLSAIQTFLRFAERSGRQRFLQPSQSKVHSGVVLTEEAWQLLRRDSSVLRFVWLLGLTESLVRALTDGWILEHSTAHVSRAGDSV